MSLFNKLATGLAVILTATCVLFAAPAKGPLKVLASNPRFFTDGSGKAVYLVGSHTWNNGVDIIQNTNPPNPTFDYSRYISWLKELNHNCFRLWTWEDAFAIDSLGGIVYRHEPLAYPRTGPGNCADGKPKFDISKFNPVYFDRLKSHVKQAQDSSMYAIVQLFSGWSPNNSRADAAWSGHPYNPANNINNFNGEPDAKRRRAKLHNLLNPQTTAYQEAYVRKVIETVNGFDNVLFEIANEDSACPENTAWQYHMIRFIHETEKGMAKQHPAGMTFQWPGGTNADLLACPGEWISPAAEGGYQTDPPAADGTKVIINDTDHTAFWIALRAMGYSGQRAWVWKNMTRGNNLLFMDPYLNPAPWYVNLRNGPFAGRPDPYWDHLRINMGYARRYADRINLAAAKPRPELASTGYCMAVTEGGAAEYLVYVPLAPWVTVDLSGVKGMMDVEWFYPMTGTVVKGDPVTAGSRSMLTAPFKENDVVLYLSAKKN